MIRKYIRKKVQQVLKDANIQGVEQDVFCRKSSPHDDNELPYICIYGNTESANRFDEAPKRYLRSFEIVIEAITTHDDDEKLSDELDDLSYAIELALESDKVLQGLEADVNGQCYEDTEITSVQYDTQADGSGPIGAVRLTYAISYVASPYTESIPDVFGKVESEWKIGDHGDNKAVDEFDIPQE